MDDTEILAEIRTHTFVDGEKTKLTCAHAHLSAKRCRVSISEIGRVCNEHGIRICQCQLGCF